MICAGKSSLLINIFTNCVVKQTSMSQQYFSVSTEKNYIQVYWRLISPALINLCLVLHFSYFMFLKTIIFCLGCSSVQLQLTYSEQSAQVCNIITTERLEESSREALFVTPKVTANSINEPQKGDRKISLWFKETSKWIFSNPTDFLFEHANPTWQ